MKVLLLHQHFKTPQHGGAIRSYYLAQALILSGIEVVVISAHDKKPSKELIDGIEVHFLYVPYNNSFGFWRRGISFLKFLIKTVRKVKVLSHFDLCYAISVPLTVGLAARRIKKHYGIQFIFEVGDLWPDAPIQMGFVNNHFLKKILYGLEHKIYHSAESIVALSPAIKSAIEKKISNKKITVIPNMADLDFFEKANKDPNLELQYDVRGRFVVSYVGALGVANGLEFILDCADASRKAQLPIQFLICGEGAVKSKLLRKIEQLELTNIKILDFTNRDGVRDILRISDAAFICYKAVPILETGSPNKFFDALAAGKLCIINFSGWIKDEIETADCGIYVDPQRPSDFVKKIKPFLSDRFLLENYQFNARTLAENKFSRKALSEKFSELVIQTIT